MQNSDICQFSSFMKESKGNEVWNMFRKFDVYNVIVQEKEGEKEKKDALFEIIQEKKNILYYPEKERDIISSVSRD